MTLYDSYDMLTPCLHPRVGMSNVQSQGTQRHPCPLLASHGWDTIRTAPGE